MKCPACGATVDSSALKCPECGYVFSEESSVAKDIRTQIDQFQQRLSAAKTDKARADVIRSFNLPNTVDGLLNTLSVSVSGFESSNGNEDKMVSAAWLEKARQAYGTLKAKAGTDRQIQSQLERYSFLEGKDSLPKVKESASKKKKRSILRWVIILAVLALLIYLFLLIVSNMDEDQPAEKTVRQEVMEMIQEKEYDKARIKAAEAEYSWDQKELLQMIDEAENK